MPNALEYLLARLPLSRQTWLRLAANIGALTGWRRNLLAFVCGVVAVLALAPFFWFPLLIPSFTLLMWLLAGTPTRRRMFWDGWWWGWGFAIAGLYWFCIALLTDAAHFAWLIPFALFALTGIIALYNGIACWLLGCLRLNGLSRLFAFSVIWTLVEYARGHLFSGFPWNLAGYSFEFSLAAMQLASLIGAYGLTWFAVLLAVTFAAIGDAVISNRRTGAFIGITWLAFALGLTWGTARLHAAGEVPEADRYVEGVKLRLVQANISQPHKWDAQLRMQGLKQHIDLTKAPGKLDEVTHVIWPETAAPYALTDNSPLTHLLGNAVPAGKFIITGALRVEGEGENFQIWNSLAQISHEGKIVGAYDKFRLVPFGEFLPLRSLLPKAWLTPVGDKDFSRGPGSQTLNWPGLPPVMPLVCYEAIFPEAVAGSNKRPEWLLNVTNDAWFGHSTGPYQHFAMARLRAVEQAIPIVRVANTGITAVVNSYGIVETALPLGIAGVLDARLPKAQNHATTYGKVGDAGLLILTLLLLPLILRQRKHK